MVVDRRPGERETDRLFHALADPTRRDIVRRAMHGDHSISSLARHYPMSFAAVQKHVAVLEEAGLVSKHKHGRRKLVRCNIDAIRAVHYLLEEMEALWRARMDRFGAILEDETQGENE